MVNGSSSKLHNIPIVRESVVNGRLVFSDGLGEDVTAGQVFIQNAKNLVV